jgi:hypothetical protein
MITPTCAPDNDVALAKITGSFDRVTARFDECRCDGGELSDFPAVSTVSPGFCEVSQFRWVKLFR